MKKIKVIFLSLAMIASFGAVQFLLPQSASAAPVDVFQSCQNNPNTDVCAGRGTNNLFGANSLWSRIINALIFIVGAISVIMIVVGGIRYAISNGDQGQVTSAKNTIIFAVIGLVIAFSAQVIVSFVLNRIGA